MLYQINLEQATISVGIPAGYARVGVDESYAGICQTLDLDIPGGDDEKTLGEVELGHRSME